MTMMESIPAQIGANNELSCFLLQNRFDVNYTSYFTEGFGFDKEWHKDFIPHRRRMNLVQFITFRLADSLPQSVLKEIALEIHLLDKSDQGAEKRKRYQYWLDRGLGCCALEKPEMAEVVWEAFQYHNGTKYELLGWSIMPNHVHVLIWVKHNLSKIIQSWKSYTGKWALAHNIEFGLGLEKNAKAFWMSEYWDRFIRNEEHFNNTLRYILNNPMMAGLPTGHIAYTYTGCSMER